MSFNRGMDKNVVHIYNKIPLSHKKKQKSATCSDLEGLEIIIQSYIRQKRKRQVLYIVYMWNLEKLYR